MTDIIPAAKDWCVCMADGDELAFYPVIAWIVDVRIPIPILAWGTLLSEPYAIYDPEGTAYVCGQPHRGLSNPAILKLLNTRAEPIPF